ncbi:hypothetical protein RKD49_000985 [Streptomyces glaucescens]
MRRWIKATVAAAVLGLGGWIAEPYVQDWMLVRGACSGALPGDAVRQLASEADHFEDAESRTYEELGDYTCRVTIEGDELRDETLLFTSASVRRDEQDRQFMSVFPEQGFIAQAPMPADLPGFVDVRGRLYFLVPCPELGTDDDGRQRKMLVRTGFGPDASWGTPAAYETAVALVGAASDQLGCGAEPLSAPEGDATPAEAKEEPETSDTVPLREAASLGCGWASKAGLPRPESWRVGSGTNDAAPTGRCDLFHGDEEVGDDEYHLTFAAWYGDWSNRLTREEGEPRGLTATARCAGEAANFAVDGPDEVPGIDRGGLRDLLEAFARDQMERRDCTGLQVWG